MNAIDRLPHGPRFRFVERLVAHEGETSVTAVKRVGERWCPSLAVECLAQAAGLLSGEAGGGVLAAVPRFRFRGRVRPGDLVEIRVELVRKLGRLLTARGELRVSGRRVGSGNVVLAF